MSISTSFKKKPAASAAPAAAAPVAASVAAPAVDVVATPSPQQNSTPAQTAVVPKAAAPLGEVMDYRGIGGFEGEFTPKDMATPYLSIFQKSSKGFEDNMDWLGQWVYDKAFPLGDTIRVVFVRAAKSYIEKTEFGSDVIPQRFSKIAEARAAGFSDSEMQETAELDLLIEVDSAAEGAGDLARMFDGDKAYIHARYTVRSSAYGRTVGILAKDYAGFLKGNLINGFYQLRAEQRKSDKGTYYTPSLKTDGPTPLSLRNEIIERMGLAG